MVASQLGTVWYGFDINKMHLFVDLDFKCIIMTVNIMDFVANRNRSKHM